MVRRGAANLGCTFCVRAVSPFESLADLSRIGMFPKEIEKMGKHNMLECLDVCRAKPDLER